jgi:NAD(P)-dependent dehydrogenase (short-subunit alcohol dehydrogenase family)
MLLNNKVALITGGSRGIGEGIAVSASKAGANIVLTYNENSEKAELVCEELRRSGGKALALKMQVQDRDSVKEAISKAKESFGNINILVNNAAIAQEKPFDTITDDDWDRMMSVNLRGPFSLIQETIPSMLDDGWGRIINISSIGGQWGGFNQVHYAAAKAGLINLTRSIAKIYSAQGITSNAIAPGLVATEMAGAELVSDAGKAKVTGIPSGRIGTVTDIGAAVVYLGSDDASYITGQTLNLNGGMYFAT